jgi:hypothetical protein
VTLVLGREANAVAIPSDFIAAIEKNLPQDALQRQLERGTDVRYAQKHQEEWRKEYPDMWLAIHGEHLEAADADRDKVFSNLKKKGIDPADVYLIFLTAEKIDFFL